MSASVRLLLAAVHLVAAQRGSPYRCRDHEPQCAEWAGRGECEKNFDFMIDKCPVSCDVCANGNLDPTPSPFQFEFVCKGKLATAPSTFKGTPQDDAPSGCAFSCADKMSAAVCAKGLAEGACKRKATAKAMRFGCAATCGVCSGIGMESAREAVPLPKCEKGDADTGGTCEAWASTGECFRNYDYMKEACPRACGICSDDGQARVLMDEAVRKRPAGTGGKKGKKKKKKKTVLTEVPLDDLPEAAAEAPKAAAEPEPAEPAAEEGEAKKKKRGFGAAVKDVLGKVPGFRKKENAIELKDDGKTEL